MSEGAKAGAAHLPRNAREARRRYPADEASRDGPRAKAAGGRGARAGARRRARRNGAGRAAELDQRCHARPRSGPQPRTPKQIDGELRRTATRSCICIQRAVAWTRKSPKMHRAHGCPARGRTLEGKPAQHGGRAPLRRNKPHIDRHRTHTGTTRTQARQAARTCAPLRPRTRHARCAHSRYFW